MYFVTRY